MSEDFFGDLGKSISRYTKKAVDRTSTMVEAAKISAQISGERREVDKLYQKIGETVYRKAAEKSIELDDDLTAFVEDIHQRKEKMASLTRDLADVKGQKVCQNCGELIPKNVAFCPKCGAPTPVAETEQKEASKQDRTDDLKQKEPEKTEEQKQKDMEAMDAEFTEIHDETADEEKAAAASDEKSAADPNKEAVEETASDKTVEENASDKTAEAAVSDAKEMKEEVSEDAASESTAESSVAGDNADQAKNAVDDTSAGDDQKKTSENASDAADAE